MKPINKTLYDTLKMSLRLSEVGEVSRNYRVGIAQVAMVNKSKDYPSYCQAIDESNYLQQLDHENATREYITPATIQDIVDNLQEIKKRLQGLQVNMEEGFKQLK